MDLDSNELRAAYPFKSRYLELDGHRYHYIDEGSGSPVVMVHGNPTWSFYFRDLVRTLRKTHRCIVPDHIGCGLSDKPDEGAYSYRLEQRARDLDALLDHLGLEENVTLVLHDWGGMIGMAAACMKPERISRLVVLNTAAFLLPEGHPFPWQLKFFHGDGSFARWAVQRLNLFARGAAWTATTKGLTRDARRGLLAPYDTYDNRLATHLFVCDIPLTPDHPSYETAARVDARLELFTDRPMLICWGMNDFVFDAGFLAEWHRRFPEAEVHTFGDAGHYVLEDATEAVCMRVAAFLQRHARRPSAVASEAQP